MKTGYLTLIFALACAACTPRFYPPKVDVPRYSKSGHNPE